MTDTQHPPEAAEPASPSELIEHFWKERDPSWWGIDTRLIRMAKERVVKASILYGKKVISTGHSDFIPQDAISFRQHEQQAIGRAILNCPPGLHHDKIRK
jgi:hypothetical protein